MKNIVLVGAGGAGMSSLGGLLLALGFTNIVCINNTDSPIVQRLGQQGAKLYIGHGKYKVTHLDIVIYSAAAVDTPEVQQAFAFHEADYKKTPPPMLFHQCMGEISKYFRTIAVTGTHGKSSTSSMLAYTLKELSNDFGVAVIGAKLSNRDGDSFAYNTHQKKDIRSIFDHIFFRKGQPIGELMKKYRFVVEADEFNKHFLFLDPDYALITNCELDHLDTYGNEDNYFHTFYQFMKNVRYNIFTIDGDSTIQKLLAYNQKQENPVPSPIPVSKQQYTFEHIIGGHNNSNASLVEHCITTILPNSKSHQIITTFKGIMRRGERLGETSSGVPVYSDYGHHPTEIASTLLALREQFPHSPIHVLFQPHQMARVVQFWDAFHTAMQPKSGEKRAYSPIYAARETISGCQEIFPTHGVIGSTQGVQTLHIVTTSHELSQSFADQGGAPLLTKDEEVLSRINNLNDGICIYFSAGNLDKTIRQDLFSL